jgi:uncharacterized protein YigA (DUF484 family)
MSTREARGIQAPQSEEETVAHYLQQNPEFVENHLPLLARLRLPHARGSSTISLVERQVEVLRERHAALEQKLHRFTRRLLRAQTRQSAIEQLEASLREDFDSFHSVLVLIGEPDSVAPQRFVRLVGAEDANLKSFESLFTSGKPRCGQARDSQRDFLFAADAPDIGSVALVPLGDHGSLGLLALGSTDRDRFHPGMSTDFLSRLADLISDVLSRP